MVLGKSAGWLFGLKIGSIPVAPTIPPSPTRIDGRRSEPDGKNFRPSLERALARPRRPIVAERSIGLVGFPHECGQLGVETCRVLIERGVADTLIDRKPGARDDRGGVPRG